MLRNVMLGLAVTCASSALASTYIATVGESLVDYNLGDGAFAGSRPISPLTGSIVGVEYWGGSAYVVTSQLGPANPQQILRVDPVTGAATEIGTVDFDAVGRLSEGGLAYNDLDGTLIAGVVTGGNTSAIQIDAATGDVIGQFEFASLADRSGLGFDGAGNFYALNTSGSGAALEQYLLDGTLVSTNSIVDSAGGNINLELLAGLDWDPTRGQFIAGTFVNGSPDNRQIVGINLDGSAEALDLLPGTGAITGLAFVPEPASLVLIALAGLTLRRR